MALSREPEVAERPQWQPGRRDIAPLLAMAWLVVCPLLFGGADLWARAAGWIVAGLCLLFLELWEPRWLLPFRQAAGAFAALLAWWAFALVPMPAGLVGWISPARAAASSDTVQGGSDWLTLSYDPWRGMEAWLTVAAWLMLALVLAHAARHHDGRRRLIVTILLSAAAVMVVAWLNLWTPGRIYTRVMAYPSYMGPFSGRNIFGDYLAACALVGLGLIFQRWWPLQGKPRKSLFTLIAAGIILCSIGWVLRSTSRGAALALATGLLTFTLVLWKLEARHARALGLVLLVGLLGGLILVYAQTLVHRFETGREEEGRFDLWRHAWSMARDHPLAGVGLGNFSVVFPRYQTGLDPKLYTHPENQYLELLLEAGWPGALLALGFGWWALRGGLQRRKWKDLEWMAGGLAGLAAVLTHALFDFPLAIPAAALLALSIAALIWGNVSRRHVDPAHGRALWGRLAMVAFALLLLIAGSLALRAEWLFGHRRPAEASRIWPQKLNYFYEPIESRLAQADFLGAHRLAIQAQRYHPTDWRLHYLDGWALAPLTLRTDEARATFDKAILWSPAKSETARKAGLFFWPRRPEIAYDFWTRALELDPDPKRAYLAFLQKSGEIPGWPAFARVLAGNRPRRLVTLAQFLTDRQNSQGVPEVLAAAVAAAPRDVAVQEDLAIALLRHDQTAMAEQFLASIPLRTDRLRYARAECDRRLGRTDESLRVFHTLPSEHLPLASVSAGEIQLAAQKADAAPADFHLQTAYALLLVEGRRWAEADAQWERIHAQWPAYVEAFRYRAACLEQLGKTPEAAEQWSAYYRILLAVGY